MVPNLPSPVVVPAPGTPTAPDLDGAAMEFFAKLLGGGPPPAVIAGPGAPAADEVTLRAASADGDPEGGAAEAAPDGGVPDIIPLLQAQSGFPVAVVPPSAADAGAPAPVAAVPSPPVVPSTLFPTETAPATGAPAGSVPAAKPAQIARAVQPVPCQATGPVLADGEETASSDVVGAAIKAAVEKIGGKPAARPERGVRAGSASPVEGGGSIQPGATSAPQPQSDPIGTRIEPVIQPLTPAAAQTAVTPGPAFSTQAAAQSVSVAAATPDAAPNIAELVVARQLDLANDNQWLDRLARDIARAGASDEPLRFRLHPQTLGHLQVELSQGDRGATVRLTVETEAARNILFDAQPRLAAEARAQGVRLAGTEVELGTASQQGDARRNAEARPQDIVRVVRGAQSGSTPSEPAQSRSDRYA